MNRNMTANITLTCTAGSKKAPGEHNKTSTFPILVHFDHKVWYVEADMPHKEVKFAGVIITVTPLAPQI
jgi:hypothetical protein